MIEIIPAIMPKTYDDLVEKMGLFAGVVSLVQVDVTDGKFTQNRTWPYNARDEHFTKIASEDEGMPEWELLDFEADLMVENPEDAVGKWVAAGARRIVVHIEGVSDFEVIRNAIPEDVVEFGLALNSATPLSSIEPYLDEVDFVQCMGIANIGFQGEAFDERVFEHIRALRVLRPELPISVDGGVNFETARALVDAGATRLVSGSAILKSGDVSHAVEAMRNLVQYEE